MDDTLDSLSNVSLNESSIEFNVSEEIIHQPNEREKVIQLLLQLYSRHNLTKIAVEDVAKAMNAMPGAKVQIPATKYHLFNEFLSNSPQKVHRFIQCSKCREYSKFAFDIGSESKCEYCENEVKSSDIFFVQIEVQPQLRSIVRNNFDEILKFKQKILEKKPTKSKTHTMVNLSRKSYQITLCILSQSIPMVSSFTTPVKVRSIQFY